MPRVRTIAAGILLGTGLFVSVLLVPKIVDRNTPPAERIQPAIGFVLFGAGLVALGSWLTLQGQLHAGRTETNRLRGIFYRLLRNNQGQINVLRFSMEANISGAEAKAFLDERAREFNARFDVSEEGKISYYFDGDFARLPQALSYDVILESFPWRYRDRIAAIIQRQLGQDPRAVKAMVRMARSTPVTIARGVSQHQANSLRDELEEEGATILMITRDEA